MTIWRDDHAIGSDGRRLDDGRLDSLFSNGLVDGISSLWLLAKERLDSWAIGTCNRSSVTVRKFKEASELTSLDKDISTSPAHEAWLIREPAWAKISDHTLLLIAVRRWAVFLVRYCVDVEFHTTSNQC